MRAPIGDIEVELLEEIQAIAARIPGQKEHIQTEEGTKNALIMPFISTLGYNVFDLTEVVPEYTADFGVRRGARVDYAIMKDGKPIILFECKSADVDLDDMQTAQLAGYFAATDARFAVLTNGVVYRFHSDLDKSHRMDLRPFLEINMLELDNELCQELGRFTKASFDVSENVKAAVELKYTKEIMRLLSEQMREPSDAFVRFFATQIYSGNMNQAAKKRFAQRTKEALNQFINNRVYDRLKSAMDSAGELTPEAVVSTPESVPEEIITYQEKMSNTTTPLELEGFYIVKSILRSTVDPNRIAMRDVQSYCGILLDDINRKPICRLRFDGGKKWLGLMDEQKKEEKVAITELDDIYRYADRLRDTVARYELVAKHDEEPDRSLRTAVSYKTLKLTPRQLLKVNQSVNQ